MEERKTVAGRSARAKTLVPEGTQGLGNLTKQPGQRPGGVRTSVGRADGDAKAPEHVPRPGQRRVVLFLGFLHEDQGCACTGSLTE